MGARNGTVPGDIHAAVSNGSVTSTHFQNDSSQTNQGVTTYQKCVDLQFTVHSHDMSPAKLELRAGMLLQNYINFNPGMAVKLHLKCRHSPLGFTLRTGNGSFCGCTDALKQVMVTCNISSKTLFRPTGVWIGYVNDSVEGTGAIVHPHCPFDYCKASGNNMSLSDADKQPLWNALWKMQRRTQPCSWRLKMHQVFQCFSYTAHCFCFCRCVARVSTVHLQSYCL